MSLSVNPPYGQAFWLVHFKWTLMKGSFEMDKRLRWHFCRRVSCPLKFLSMLAWNAAAGCVKQSAHSPSASEDFAPGLQIDVSA